MFPIWIHTKEEVKRLLILGAGGFGHMIQETARLLGYEEVVFLDDAVKGADVIGKCCDYKAFLNEYDTAAAALGDSGMRLYWTEKLMKRATKFRRSFIRQRSLVLVR